MEIAFVILYNDEDVRRKQMVTLNYLYDGTVNDGQW